MVGDSQAFSSFSVNDLAAAEAFYRDILGIAVAKEEMGLRLRLGSGAEVFAYGKPDHQPATFTILNFPVGDIDAAVAALTQKGIVFEQYSNLTDEKGIARGSQTGNGPDIAWFRDPAGNVLSVLQESK